MDSLVRLFQTPLPLSQFSCPPPPSIVLTLQIARNPSSLFRTLTCTVATGVPSTSYLPLVGACTSFPSNLEVFAKTGVPIAKGGGQISKREMISQGMKSASQAYHVAFAFAWRTGEPQNQVDYYPLDCRKMSLVGAPISCLFLFPLRWSLETVERWVLFKLWFSSSFPRDGASTANMGHIMKLTSHISSISAWSV